MPGAGRRRQAGWTCQPVAGGAQPEGGEAGQVDRGGQQLEVLGHPHQPPHAGAPAAVAAAQQVGELALDLGPGGPVVGQPGGIALAGTGGGQVGLVGMDGDDPAADAAGAGLAQRADAAGDAEPGPATAAAGRADRHGHPRRAGHRAGLEVDAELVLGEAAAGCGRELGLDHRREPVLVQPGQVGAGAIGAVAVDHRLGGLARPRPGARSPSSVGATAASPLVAALTSAAQMTSVSGSTATWAL